MKPGHWLFLLILISGCTSVSTHPVDSVVWNAGPEAFCPPGIQVMGYVTTDGIECEERGHLMVREDGDLDFRPFPDAGEPPGISRTLERESVSALLIEGREPISHVLAGIGLFALAGTMILAASALQPEEDDDWCGD